MKPFDYFEPATLDEALGLLDIYGAQAKLLAGGTDLIVQMKGGKSQPCAVIGLKKIKELDFLERSNHHLSLGPMTLLRTIATHDVTTGPFSILREAALAVGDRQIRNMATLGGNLANGSPSADMVPALLVLDAKLRLRKKGGERTVLLEELLRGPFLTHLKPEELIVEISVSHLPDGEGTYLWMPKRTAVDETLVGVGAWLTIRDSKAMSASLAANSIGPIPIRLREAEDFLQGKTLGEKEIYKTGEIAAREVAPRSRSEYRRRIVSVLVVKALEKLSGRAEK